MAKLSLTLEDGVQCGLDGHVKIEMLKVELIVAWIINKLVVTSSRSTKLHVLSSSKRTKLVLGSF
jgi:hypothetical protein